MVKRAPAPNAPWSPAGTYGGMRRWPRPTAPREPVWCDAGGPALHPIHLRLHRKAQVASSTAPPGTCWARRSPSSTSSTTTRTTPTGAPRTSAWITGHSYIVYGPLCAGATRSCSRASRPTAGGPLLEHVEKFKVNIFTPPRPPIRSLMREGEKGRRDATELPARARLRR